MRAALVGVGSTVGAEGGRRIILAGRATAGPRCGSSNFFISPLWQSSVYFAAALCTISG